MFITKDMSAIISNIEDGESIPEIGRNMIETDGRKADAENIYVKCQEAHS